jgi:hypothetical protein
MESVFDIVIHDFQEIAHRLFVGGDTCLSFVRSMCSIASISSASFAVSFGIRPQNSLHVGHTSRRRCNQKSKMLSFFRRNSTHS